MENALRIGGNADTINAAGTIFGRCGDFERAIEFKRRALVLTPNDTNWTRTRSVIALLHSAGKVDEIKALMQGKLDAPDMNGYILLYFAYLEKISNNDELANEYYRRAIESGFSLNEFKRTFQLDTNEDSVLQTLSMLGLDLKVPEE